MKKLSTSVYMGLALSLFLLFGSISGTIPFGFWGDMVPLFLGAAFALFLLFVRKGVPRILRHRTRRGYRKAKQAQEKDET